MEQEREQDIKVSGESKSFAEDTIPQISVLLPTYKRPDALQRTLNGLRDQTLAENTFEIIVIDDGSQDGTEQILLQFAEDTTHRFSYRILEKNGGPARARNFGLNMCRAEIILIIGDDIEPDCHLVERHLHSHLQNPEEGHGVLGYVTFPEELKPNGFMKWLEKSGRKYFFNYQDLVSGQQVGHLSFYTCNVSVKKNLLDKSGWFDESFPYASHEDLELGYRLADKGMTLVYDPTAYGYHWHMLSVQGISRRVYLMGYSAVIFWQKVGEKGGGLKRFLRGLISWFAASPPGIALWEKLSRKTYPEDKEFSFQWHSLLFLSFFIGLSDSSNKRPVRL